MRASSFQSYQRAGDGPQQLRRLGAVGQCTALVQPVRQPLAGLQSLVSGQDAQQVAEHDGHGLGQAVGRQQGRRSRRLRQEG